jgi:hypothetical protein
VKVCGAHCSTVQKICNDAFISSSDNQVFDSPRKTNKSKHDVTDMNEFVKDALCRAVYEFFDKGEYPTATINKDHGGENRILYILKVMKMAAGKNISKLITKFCHCY